jgi:hypothetical protein
MGGVGMSAKNLRQLVRFTIKRRVPTGKYARSDQVALNPLHVVEVWPDINVDTCRGSVVHVRGRPRDGINVTERLAMIERRVQEALGEPGL